jgi:hypothetical protein
MQKGDYIGGEHGGLGSELEGQDVHLAYMRQLSYLCLLE